MINNNIIIASIGVLLVSCAYMLYVNHKLNKKNKLLEHQLRLNGAGPGVSTESSTEANAQTEAESNSPAEAEASAEAEAEADIMNAGVDENNNSLREEYREYQNNMDYYIDESIPDDLKREIDSLDNNAEDPTEAPAETPAEEAEAPAETPAEEAEAPAEVEAAVYDMDAIIQAQINAINETPTSVVEDTMTEINLEPPVDVDGLHKLTMKQLKDMAREKGVKITGKKDELIVRLSA